MLEPFIAAPFPRARVLEGKGMENSRQFVGYATPKRGMETTSGDTVIEVKDDVIVLGRVFRNVYGRKEKNQEPTNVREAQEITVTLTTAKQHGFDDKVRMMNPRKAVWTVRKGNLFYYVSHEMAEDRAASGRWNVGGTRVETKEVGVFPFNANAPMPMLVDEEDALREAVALNQSWSSATAQKAKEQNDRLVAMVTGGSS